MMYPPILLADAPAWVSGLLGLWLAFSCISWLLLRYPNLLHRRKPRKGACMWCWMVHSVGFGSTMS